GGHHGVPAQAKDLLAGGNVPEASGSMQGGLGERSAVGRKRQGMHEALEPRRLACLLRPGWLHLEPPRLLPHFKVPNADNFSQAARGQRPAVRRERNGYGKGELFTAVELLEESARSGLPEDDVMAVGRRRHGLAVRGEGQVSQPSVRAFQLS